MAGYPCPTRSVNVNARIGGHIKPIPRRAHSDADGDPATIRDRNERARRRAGIGPRVLPVPIRQRRGKR